MKKYTFITIPTITDKVAKQWQTLWKSAENAKIFNSYEWFLAARETNKRKPYELYACYRESVLVAILPMWKTSLFGIKAYAPVGYKYSGTPFLMETYDKDLLTFFFENIIANKTIYLPKIDKKAVTILHETFPKIFFSLMSVNPYLDKREDPERFTSTTTHKNVRRILKKYANELKFVQYEGNDDLPFWLNKMFEIEQHSTKKMRSKDIFSKKDNRDFFTNIITYCKQFVNIGFLTYDDKHIAYTFNFKYKNSFVGYQMSSLSEFKKFYPGKTILVKDLESLQNTEIDVFDFGGGISSYKQEFTPAYYYLYDLWYSTNTVIMSWWKLINRARRIKQLLFPIKNTRDHEFLFKHYVKTN